MMYLGQRTVGTTVYIPFHTFNSAGASVTLTGLAVLDIAVFKNGSVIERASTAGYTLLDTDGIDFDGRTGLHGVSINLNDNTDAGFYAAGNFYMVAIDAVTVDSQTVRFWAACFDIVEAPATIADIKSKMVEALNTDTYAEPGQGNPPATATLVQKIGYFYKWARNRVTQTNTTLSYYADDGTTVDQKATVADDGTTASRTEIVSGP